MRIWGEVWKTRLHEDKSPIQIAIERHDPEHPSNAGYGNPVIKSDGGMYPSMAVAYKAVDDPPPAFFVFIQIEKYLDENPTHRALAWSVYVSDKKVQSFTYKQDGNWIVSGRNQAYREHERLRESIADLFVDSYELTLAERAVLEARKRKKK